MASTVQGVDLIFGSRVRIDVTRVAFALPEASVHVGVIMGGVQLSLNLSADMAAKLAAALGEKSRGALIEQREAEAVQRLVGKRFVS